MNAEERLSRPVDRLPAHFSGIDILLKSSPFKFFFGFCFAGVTAALEPLNETKKDYEEMVSRWEVIGMFYVTCAPSLLQRVMAWHVLQHDLLVPAAYWRRLKVWADVKLMLLLHPQTKL